MQGILIDDYSVEGKLKCETWCVEISGQKVHVHSSRRREEGSYSPREVNQEPCNCKPPELVDLPPEVTVELL